MISEVDAVLLRVPKTVYDTCRNDSVLHRLVRLHREITGVLDIGLKSSDCSDKVLQVYRRELEIRCFLSEMLLTLCTA